MNTKTKLFIAGSATAFVMGGGLLAQSTFAATTTSTTPSLITELATKFGLKQADVQAVFDTHQKEIQVTRTQNEKIRLDTAVTNKEITSAQENLIIAKQAEIQAKMQSNRSLADTTARKTAMGQLRTDTAAWAKTNGIAEKWLMLGRRMHGPGGKGHHGMEGSESESGAPISTATPAPTS